MTDDESRALAIAFGEDRNSTVGELPYRKGLAGTASGLRVLSLSCAYPNALEPGLGVFVERRLQHLGALVQLEVVAPFSLFRYGAPGQRFRFSKPQPGPRATEAIRVHRPRWFYPPFSGSTSAVWLAAALLLPVLRIRKRFDYQLLDCHFGHPDGVAGALLATVLRVPFTVTLRGNEPAHGRSWLGRFAIGWALRTASRVYTVSDRLRQFAIGLGVNPHKVVTIPNGVDACAFFPRDRNEARRKHGVPLDRPVILSAGALIERKGHHRIIQVLPSIVEQTGPVQLVIAGGPGPEGQFEGQIRQAIAELGVQSLVRLMGPVSQETMAELMSCADVCCLASTREGWPNVVHEALACGAPVVATDVGAVPDMLPSEDYGLIVPQGDPEALCQALLRALAKPWDRHAISAWGRARSWPQVARDVQQQMESIVLERNKRNSSSL